MPLKTLLQTTLDTALAISTPTIGAPGTVKNIGFATGHMGKGLRPVMQERYASFPLSNIDLKKGHAEFWYRPINALETSTGDYHVLLMVGASIVSGPRMLLDWDDVLRLSVTDVSGRTVSVQTNHGEKLWAKNAWVRVAIEWEADSADDSLRIFINGVRKSNVHVQGGWSLSGMATDAAIFVGCAGKSNTAFADGTIDELTITTDDDVIVEPPPPPPTQTKSGLLEVPDPVGPFGREPSGASLSVASFIAPAAGSTIVEQTFGTTIRGMPAGSVHEYSQLQTFTDDGMYVLLIEQDGYAIRRYSDLTLIAKSWWTSPKWIPGTHKLLVIEGGPVTYYTIDADAAGAKSVVMTLPQFMYASGARSHEAMSEDGRWTGLYVNNDGQGGRWVCAVDIIDKRLGAARRLQDIQPSDPQWGLVDIDWVGISPLGRYMVVQQLSMGKGLELYDVQTGQHVRQIYDHHNHSDVGVAPDGREFVATTSLTHPDNNNYPSIVVHWLDGTPAKHLRMIDWDRSEHYSCKGPRGKILVSAGGRSRGGPLGPLEGELYVISLDGSVQRLVHHRSISSDYWMMPKASISKDGKRIIWSTDLGISGKRHCFVIEDVVL